MEISPNNPKTSAAKPILLKPPTVSLASGTDVSLKGIAPISAVTEPPTTAGGNPSPLVKCAGCGSKVIQPRVDCEGCGASYHPNCSKGKTDGRVARCCGNKSTQQLVVQSQSTAPVCDAPLTLADLMAALDPINKTMREIKGFTSKVEAEFKKINLKVDKLQSSLVLRISGVETSLVSIEDRVSANEKAVQRALDAPAVNQSSEDSITACIGELADREHRKANLLVHGLADSDVRKSDSTTLNSFLAALMKAPVTILRCQRLGTFSAALAKPRPIVVTLTDNNTAKLVLQAFRAWVRTRL